MEIHMEIEVEVWAKVAVESEIRAGKDRRNLKQK